jgi:hypothetical protein
VNDLHEGGLDLQELEGAYDPHKGGFDLHDPHEGALRLEDSNNLYADWLVQEHHDGADNDRVYEEVYPNLESDGEVCITTFLIDLYTKHFYQGRA